MKTYIPNTLKENRKRIELTQKQVADHLGLQSTDRISRWEKGLGWPHVVNLRKLAKLYRVTMEELYPEPSTVIG